jgi:DNA-directed RNA polymerase subunit M/transcription elongation factor TFIIS
MKQEKIICPNCGNKDNFHFNYNYSEKDLPLTDILCNECGEIFNLKD